MPSRSWMATLATIIIAFAGGFLAGNRESPDRAAAQNLKSAGARCYFSPRGGCIDAVIDQIKAAQHSIELQGYAFTSEPIAQALVAAYRRGVNVTLVLDAAQTSEHRDQARKLIHAGIPVYLDAGHAIADNRLVLIDEHILITGSYSFTPAAEQENAENVLILRNEPQLQAAYEDNFHTHLTHSQRYDGN